MGGGAPAGVRALPVQAGTGTTPGDVDHYWCCDENTAMCGTDLTGVRRGPEFYVMCALCVGVRVGLAVSGVGVQAVMGGSTKARHHEGPGLGRGASVRTGSRWRTLRQLGSRLTDVPGDELADHGRPVAFADKITERSPQLLLDAHGPVRSVGWPFVAGRHAHTVSAGYPADQTAACLDIHHRLGFGYPRGYPASGHGR